MSDAPSACERARSTVGELRALRVLAPDNAGGSRGARVGGVLP